MTTEEAVARGATLMADAERALLTAQKKLAALPAVFAAVEGIGALETMMLSAEARALAGDAASTELAVVSFHRALTTRAQELGIDLPQPRSGGGR
jgi:hypothetical protein